jgi:hypothetical protein
MKKQYIIIILIIVLVLIVAGYFIFFKGGTSKQSNFYRNQNVEEVTIDSLSVGNWVSIVAEKNNDSYIASMVMVCDSKESCQNNRPNSSSGSTPTGNPPTDTGNPSADNQNKNRTGSMENRTMLSGTIKEIGTDNLTLTLDTGETATVSISDSTRIIKR